MNANDVLLTCDYEDFHEKKYVHENYIEKKKVKSEAESLNITLGRFMCVI